MSGTLKIDWRETETGIWMSTREPWTDAHTRRFNELGATGLGLTGRDATNLGFLRELDGLAHLLLFELERDSDWPVLGELTRLQTLRLDLPYLKPLPDLSRLRALRRLTLGWHRGQEQLLDSVPPLREVGLMRWGRSDLTALRSHVGSLRQLHLTAARRITDLDELSAAAGLESLRLTHCTSLHGLAPLRALPELRRLAIDRCGRLSDFGVLAELRQLRSLHLGNTTIDDLDALRGLPHLEHLVIDGTVGSGDLSPLLTLPSLRVLNLQDRPGYSHGLADLQQTLGLDPDAYPEPAERAAELN